MSFVQLLDISPVPPVWTPPEIWVMFQIEISGRRDAPTVTTLYGPSETGSVFGWSNNGCKR